MKEILEKVRELRKSTYGKAILFFGFYLVFFLIISLVARIGGSGYTSSDEYEKSKSFTISFGKLLNKNYSFNYNVTLDDSVYSYKGSHYEDYELFNYNNNEYFIDDDKVYKKEDKWVLVENPYKFYYALEVDSIVEMIKESYFEYKTSYESGKNLYNFLISTNTLNKLVYNKDTDYDDQANRIVVSQDGDGNIEKITYYLDSYCKVNNLCSKSLKIEIDYDNYGKVSEIDNPIDSLED